MDRLSAAIESFCVHEAALALAALGAYPAPSLAGVPGRARIFVPADLALPVLDWAWRARVWTPECDAICCPRFGARDQFPRSVAFAVLLGFVRHFCARQEALAARVAESIGTAAEVGAGRGLSILGGADLLLIDAARRAGVWSPATTLFGAPEEAA